MEPININISVQVGLTEDTGRTLRELFLRDRGTAASHTPNGTERAAVGTKRTEKRPETTENGTGKTAEAAPKAESAPAVTDSVLREAVKRAKDRTDVKTVRALFTEFGIGASSECPEAKRPELLRRLDNLEKGGTDNA